MTHIAESHHWYGRDGTPQYEIMGANGKLRPVTLRDARKFGWYPGVTSIIKCAAAPGLEIWKQKQVLLAALTLPRIDGESNDDLCARIMADSGEQAKKARERGTEIHAAVQGHYEGKAPDESLWPFVKGVSEHVLANFGEQSWVSEEPCAHELGFGTKADLSSPAVIVDFKGSEFTEAEAPALKTWDEHAMQLAATREARKLPGAGCAIVYVSRTVPGLAQVCRIDEAELARGWQMFCGLVAYWQAKSSYYPQLWKAKEAA